MKNTNTSNRFNNNGYISKSTAGEGCLLVSLVMAILAIAVYLQGWWLQSLLFDFTGVTQSMWITCGVFLALNWLTPKKIAGGLPIFGMFAAQCYVWFVLHT